MVPMNQKSVLLAGLAWAVSLGLLAILMAVAFSFL